MTGRRQGGGWGRVGGCVRQRRQSLPPKPSKPAQCEQHTHKQTVVCELQMDGVGGVWGWGGGLGHGSDRYMGKVGKGSVICSLDEYVCGPGDGPAG